MSQLPHCSRNELKNYWFDHIRSFSFLVESLHGNEDLFKDSQAVFIALARAVDQSTGHNLSQPATNSPLAGNLNNGTRQAWLLLLLLLVLGEKSYWSDIEVDEDVAMVQEQWRKIALPFWASTDLTLEGNLVAVWIKLDLGSRVQKHILLLEHNQCPNRLKLLLVIGLLLNQFMEREKLGLQLIIDFLPILFQIEELLVLFTYVKNSLVVPDPFRYLVPVGRHPLHYLV